MNFIKKIFFLIIFLSNISIANSANIIYLDVDYILNNSKPGKTLLINHFKINDKFYIVDLPGYGYAKTSKKIINEIKVIHESYFKSRKQLLFTFLLIDLRHELQKTDLKFMEFLNRMVCPFIIIFTKSDKIRPDQVIEKVSAFKNNLLNYWEDLPKIFITSSINKTGVDEILEFIDQSIKENSINYPFNISYK